MFSTLYLGICSLFFGFCFHEVLKDFNNLRSKEGNLVAFVVLGFFVAMFSFSTFYCVSNFIFELQS